MPTYVYESIPSKKGQPARVFEIRQSIHDKPLTRHPETGESIRRAVTAGNIMSGGSSKGSASSGGCGGSCACHPG